MISHYTLLFITVIITTRNNISIGNNKNKKNKKNKKNAENNKNNKDKSKSTTLCGHTISVCLSGPTVHPRWVRTTSAATGRAERDTPLWARASTAPVVSRDTSWTGWGGDGGQRMNSLSLLLSFFLSFFLLVSKLFIYLVVGE